MQTESVVRGHSPWEKPIHAQNPEQLEAGAKLEETSGNSPNPSSASSPTQRAQTPPNNWKTIKPPNGSTIGSEDSPRTPESEGANSFRTGAPRTQTPPSLLGKDPVHRVSPSSNMLPVKQPVSSGLSQATSIWGSLGTQWSGGSIWNDSTARTPSPPKPGSSTSPDSLKNPTVEEHSSAFNELDEPIPPYRQQRRDEHRQQRSFSEVGKGVPLHALPSQGPLYIVEFKAGRTDVFYTAENCGFTAKKGDLVIVEADRGKDLGKVVNDTITPQQVQMLQAQQQQQQQQQQQLNPDGNGEARPAKEVQPKMIYRLAQPGEIALLVTKNQDEAKAMLVCQTKVRQKKLPMEVVDAEYQWDRRKLTFYFVAERRIDFRELVRDLFKLYKTRIWMCAVNPMTAKVGKI
ncbi:PSP1-domain-containing protein [Basidiobolus meristosporus CBS 931.73]|uniref:PSP1-domain-containing protein n=1 Tax=Basidiobolus meristosporus CBS 931.73 TaxID=1314790 RepID=A0A1Y1Y0T0_9FUNG|nr:PSP1-domain-containing protein [Basidiobolus meristosporus CBS 931.73]|eukprot:ORX91505.1 PSP1-domain-containing protein [Basidiobolus meristosporus CBS 931.73]